MTDTRPDGRFLPLNEPSIGEREKRYVLETLEAGFVSTAGPIVAQFEEAFAHRLGVEHAIAVSSGTAALHLSLLAVGVGPGDIVATSDLTFIASANAVSYTGADVLFVGPTLETWNLDTARLYEHVARLASDGRQLPASIEPVHILGTPAYWEPLNAIRSEFGIPIVEDATEALGASCRHDGVWTSCGRLGEIGCFSFNGNKLITTGGGGMVVTDDSTLADRIRHLSTQAKLPGVGYSHDAVGFNYRLPALGAALGLAQLEQLDEFVAKKRTIRSWYQAALRHLPLELVPIPSWARPAHWLVSARLVDSPADRDQLIRALNERGIGARPMWAPMHRQAPYQDRVSLGTEVSTLLADSGLSLPSSVGLTRNDVDRVADTLTVLLSHR